MADTTSDPWQTGRPWQIVRADLDLAHVFLPLSSFTFEAVTREDGVKGYTIAHTFQAPNPDCFASSFLVPVGTGEPVFENVAQIKTLPLYDNDSANAYADVSAKIATHMDQNRDVKRLEGVIRVPCHAHGAELADGVVEDHSPLWIKTLIHVYQFGNVVDGKRPLLVLRAPLSPVCPTNGDGTALGWS
jgi:hypothetical protein